MKKKSLLFIAAVATLTVSTTSCKKKGCMDSEAANYSEEAKKDDGSCTYETTFTSTTDVNGTTAVQIKDRGEGVGTTTFTNDKVWILDGLVFVNEGQTLTIEAGTVIRGVSGDGENASALVVARGAQINAEGTSSAPIIFTSTTDKLDGTDDITSRGEWGGLIVLGNASLNSSPGETAIEGIATTETRGLYGGSDDTDNSGTLKYISIRHGGTDIGSGNEINGLTLGGVGSGTTIEYIEVIANKDDGIECFGGTPQIKYLVLSNCGDDSFDYDEGYRGKNQFVLAVQDVNEGDRLGEHDGGTDPETATPYAHPVFYNATYIGRGISAGKRTLTFRDNAGGEYRNSVFMNQGNGIDVEKLASGEDSYARFVAGELVIANNVFYEVAVAGTAATAADVFTVSFGDDVTPGTEEATFQASFSTNGNAVADPGINTTTLNPVPTNSANVANGVAPTDSWFTSVTYQGAFDPAGSNWASGWTRLFQ